VSGWLTRLAAALGLPRGLATVAAWGAILILGLLLLMLATCIHDRRLIARHDALRDAALSGAARTADAHAAAARRADDGRLASEMTQLNEVLAHVPSADPPGAARRAYYDCIRLQQGARAAGAPAPAC
jgi:hypothetical protein